MPFTNILSRLATSCAGFVIAACTSAPVIHETREASTGIAPGESVAIVIKSRTGPDGVPSASESDQQTIAACMVRGMHDMNPRLVIAHNADTPGVRYLVEVEARTTHSEGKWEGAGGRGGGAIARTWVQTSEFNAAIFDVEHVRIAGRVSTTATGHEGGGVMLILILPVPFGYWSSSEARACEALGKGVARLITG